MDTMSQQGAALGLKGVGTWEVGDAKIPYV